MDIELTLDAFERYRLTNQCRIVRTGEEALDYLLGEGEYSNRNRYPLPDLILLDLKLPGISGIDVLREIKGRPAPSKEYQWWCLLPQAMRGTGRSVTR